jgi:hypothetical protein
MWEIRKVENVTLQTVEFKMKFVATFFFQGRGWGLKGKYTLTTKIILTYITGICYKSGDWIEHRQCHDRF